MKMRIQRRRKLLLYRRTSQNLIDWVKLWEAFRSTVRLFLLALLECAKSMNSATTTISEAWKQTLSWDISSTSVTRRMSKWNKPSVKIQIMIEKADCIFKFDFLDPIQNPTLWSIQTNTTEDLVTVRSLQWQGYLAYHFLNRKEFGGIYFGQAMQNTDVSFFVWNLHTQYILFYPLLFLFCLLKNQDYIYAEEKLMNKYKKMIKNIKKIVNWAEFYRFNS